MSERPPGRREEIPRIPSLTEADPVFEAPWEGRAFALVMSLHEQGLFRWEEFQGLLVEEIRAWEAAHPAGAEYSYYELWLQALERLLGARALCDAIDLDRRVEALGRQNPGHDHVARRDPITVSRGRSGTSE